MEALLTQLPGLFAALWWPFCRAMALFSAAPIIGENMVPVTVRVLLSLALAVVLLPVAGTVSPVDPLSLRGVTVTVQQVLIGFGIGFAFHLTLAAIMLLGNLVSSQMGLMMAMMNDPMSGASSDVVSGLLFVLAIAVFFAIDGHLVLTGILGASFHVWPVGGGFDLRALEVQAYGVAWMLSAGLLLALPAIFAALVVQVGFGFLNRVAPALNLYAIGFSALILFGLFVLAQMVAFLPGHYVRLTQVALQSLHPGLR